MKIVFLYTELAGYIVNCMNHTVKKYPDLEIHVVRWPLNKEAPFDFEFNKIKDYNKYLYTTNELVKLVDKINPDCIISSGWIDKDYNSICKSYKNRIPVIVAFDNQWSGSLKQRIAQAASGLLIRDKFNGAWVPGGSQKTYALKMRFKLNQIFEGFYSANVGLFQNYYLKSKQKKESAFPKKLLYVGRYVEHKGIFEMWESFIKTVESKKYENWELWCVGTGEEWENRIQHEKIKHFGFLQPLEFEEIISETSIYILPSKFEPWGVSLHEFVAAGFPILVSDSIGAKDSFLTKENGVEFSHKKDDSLAKSMKNMMNLSQSEFIKMQNESIKLSLIITPQKWAETLMKIANGKN